MRAKVFVFVFLSVFWLPLVYETGASAFAETPKSVIVGGYQFEPFVEEENGVTVSFIQLLNAHQNRFDFQFMEIPARRRYDLMADGKIDMIMFEMPVWGWTQRKSRIAVTDPILIGAGIVVARAGNLDAGLDIFRDLTSKKLALTLGYHYGFAGLSSDPGYLKKNYNVVFAEYQRHTLRRLLAGAADVAIINDAFLERECRTNPVLRKRLLISPKPDQRYELPVMVREGGPISASEMTDILKSLSASGALQDFFEREGIGKFLVFGK